MLLSVSFLDAAQWWTMTGILSGR